MALQSSGAISLSNIQTEFGGTNPIGLSEYYSKGNAPASGEIQLAADFYGTSNSVSLNFATHGSVSGTSATINIGTARSTRMVHLVGKGSTESNVTINGSSMALSSNYVTWFAYAKVPTGTTASIAWSNTATVYVTTFDTVNSGTADSGTGNVNTTYTFLANEGVCIWGGTAGIGSANPPTDITLSTNNSGGVNYIFQDSPNGGGQSSEVAYSPTSSGVNQTFTCTYSGTLKGGSPNLAQIFYTN